METISRISRELPAADGQSLVRLHAEADRLRARGRIVEIVHNPVDDTFRLIERVPRTTPTAA